MPAQKTELNTQAIVYSDFMVNFDIHPVSGDLVLATNEDAVKRSVKNLILTNFYEKPFFPTLGSGILSLEFENWTPMLQENIKTRIKTTITNFEPRAKVISIYITPDPDHNSVNCTITFSLLNSDTPVTLTLPLFRIR